MLHMPGPFPHRPRLGTRYLAQNNFGRLVHPLCCELSTWQAEPRLAAARLLRVSLVLVEEAAGQYLNKLLPALCRAVVERDMLGAAAADCCAVLGCFSPFLLCLQMLEPLVRDEGLDLQVWGGGGQGGAAGAGRGAGPAGVGRGGAGGRGEPLVLDEGLDLQVWGGVGRGEGMPKRSRPACHSATNQPTNRLQARAAALHVLAHLVRGAGPRGAVDAHLGEVLCLLELPWLRQSTDTGMRATVLLLLQQLLDTCGPACAQQVHRRAHTYTHARAHTHTHTYTRMCTHTHTHTRAHTHIRTCAYTHAHTCTHSHTHTTHNTGQRAGTQAATHPPTHLPTHIPPPYPTTLPPARPPCAPDRSPGCCWPA